MKRIRKEIKKWAHDLRTAGRPESAAMLYRTALAWTVKTTTYIRNEKKKLGQSYRETREAWTSERVSEDVQPYPFHYQSIAASFMFIGAWFFFGLEAFVAALLSQLKMELPPVSAGLVGIGIALALTFGSKAFWARILGHYEQEPKRAAHVVSVSNMVVMPIAFILLIVAILASRSEENSLLLDRLFMISTSVLSLVLPTQAGVLFVGAGLFGWSKRLSSEYQQWEEIERQVEITNEFVQLTLAKLEPSERQVEISNEAVEQTLAKLEPAPTATTQSAPVVRSDV
jgi:hypothetical protein